MGSALIKNGTVVTATENMQADVLIQDTKIVAIVASGSIDLGLMADRTIDAAGKLVIPGGIDVHTHMELRAGVDAQFDAGSDNVSATVGGAALNFSAELDDQVAGFVGVSLASTTADGKYSFSGSGEAQSTFDGGYQFTADITASMRF